MDEREQKGTRATRIQASHDQGAALGGKGHAIRRQRSRTGPMKTRLGGGGGSRAESGPAAAVDLV